MIKLIERSSYLYVTGDEAKIVWLKNKLRYHPKNYWRADAYRCYRATDGTRGWDGYKYPLKRLPDGWYEVLRGRKDDILDLCVDEGIRVDRKELAVSPFEDWELTDIPDGLLQSEFELDENQKTAVLEWLRHGMGIANMAVNAGKTATFAAAAALIKHHYPKARFLYFTFSERLVRQVYKAMCEFLPDWHITQFGGGGKDNTGKDMVVATQAMLNRHFGALEEDKWFRSFLGLLLDESHHCQSKTAQKVILASKAFFRLGASDSLKEADPDKWNAIRGLCGPVRCGVTSSWLIEEGRSAKPILYLVDIPEWNNKFDYKSHDAVLGSRAQWFRQGQWESVTYMGPVYKTDKHGEVVMRKRRKWVGDEWKTEEIPETEDSKHRVELDGKVYRANARYVMLDRRYDRAIIQFDERNELICDWAAYYSAKGWPTLVVATRTTHVLILEDLLRERIGNRVTLLFGEDASGHRDKVFNWFKSTPGSVLVTPLVKEGVSINEIKAGIIADPIADAEVARQVIGRFMRRKEDDNVCHITWFVDRQHPRYRQNVRNLVGELEALEGFTFYHPVAGPGTIGQALVHAGGASQGRNARRSRSGTPARS